MRKIKYDAHVWEGWTVADFIEELDPMIDMVMNGGSYIEPFSNRQEVKQFCMDNQPYYKKYIKAVVDHYCQKFNIK